MVAFYPDHVKIMFSILQFVNMDIEILSDLFKGFINIDGIEVSPYNARFSDYGIESTLFLNNCASLIFSLCFSVFTLAT